MNRGEQVAMVDRCRTDLSMRRQCALLGLARSEFYRQPAADGAHLSRSTPSPEFCNQRLTRPTPVIGEALVGDRARFSAAGRGPGYASPLSRNKPCCSIIAPPDDRPGMVIASDRFSTSKMNCSKLAIELFPVGAVIGDEAMAPQTAHFL
jgi:hypothetical protein